MGGFRLAGAGLFCAACLVAAVLATVGGVLFDLVHGGTTVTRSVAYALWFAAAVALVLMVPAGSKLVWRSSRVQPIESWWLVSAAIAFVVVGALVDALGGS